MPAPRAGRQARVAATGLALKARSRSELHGKNAKLIETLRRSSQLVREYGEEALILMAGRGIRLAEVGSLLARKKEQGGDITDYVIEGEREALKRRYFAP